MPSSYSPRPFAFVRILALCLLAGPACSGSPNGSLSPGDRAAIAAADSAYAVAWLTNDPEQVMETLVGDAVLLPSGLPAVEGDEAIREFWWPADSPTTTVTEFTVDQREIGGSGDFGFVHGSFSLGFEFDGETYASGGNYISLLTRGPDARWRISPRMWTDRP